MLSIGDQAPEFKLLDELGRLVKLSDFLGKKVVLYFYPKDDTPGCTKEACSLRDNYDKILAKGAVVIGVSKDKPESHDKFKRKYNLPFYLASDPQGTMMEAYGAFGEKKSFGKTVLGTIRCTYIIDEKGVILHVFPKVTPEGHGEEVLKHL